MTDYQTAYLVVAASGVLVAIIFGILNVVLGIMNLTKKK